MTKKKRHFDMNKHTQAECIINKKINKTRPCLGFEK